VSSRPEVEWDEVEQTWMLALQYYRDGLCPACGRPVDVCQNPDNEMKWTSPPPVRCHATTAVRERQDAQTSGKVKPRHADALLYRAELKD
jgi:hypothetical protein